MAARCSRESSGVRSTPGSGSDLRLEKGQWALMACPGFRETTTWLLGFRPWVRLEAGTFTGARWSMAEMAKRSSWLNGLLGESWQRAHFISMPRKAEERICALLAMGRSF